MKTLKHGLLVSSLVLSSSIFACSMDGKDGFLPDNSLRIPVNAKSSAGLTEEQFNSVIDSVESMYKPIVSTYGGDLSVVRKWTDATVNAYAQQNGKTWTVSMFGGLARHETITEDGFALVVCHEIGHHIAGAPLYSYKLQSMLAGWASTEGQSDYFATTKCLRKVWEADNNEEIVSKMEIPETLKKACGKAKVWNEDYYTCIRGGMAGLSVANLFASFGGPKPSFDTPDAKEVSRTNERHPASQCRLDTYFQGALCEVSMNEDFTRDSEVTGACHGSLGHSSGLRPRCWFKPTVQ